MQVMLGNPQSSPAAGALLLGFRAVSVPTPWGGTLLADPLLVTAVLVPPAGIAVPFAVPADTSLCAQAAFLQSMMLDGAAPGGVIESRGLRAQLGN